MAINVPVIVSVVEVGSPTAYLRVTWDHDITGSPATDGYLIEWDYDNPAWNPSWIVPPAVDLGLLDGNGATPVRRYTVLINLSNAFVSDWETFEEYAEGERSVLAYGGSKWAGPAVAIETDIGYKGFGDDFESYAVGQHSELGAGKGWAAPAEAIGMGDFDIVKRTISGVDDQRVVVDNSKSPWVRTMAIGSNWTKIRIGLRIGTTRAAVTWPTMPYFYFGIGAGVESVPNVAGCPNFVGISSNTQGMEGTNANYATIGSGSGGRPWRTVVVQNGSESSVAPNTNTIFTRINRVSYGLSLWFLELEKSGGNMNLNLYRSSWSDNNVGTLSDFRDCMDSVTIPSPFNENGLQTNQRTVAVDEPTYGYFDTICISFLSPTDGFEISDIDYAVLA